MADNICPRCGSKEIALSERRGIEKLARYLVPNVPYRCKGCWGRFWKFDGSLKGPWIKTLISLLCVFIALIALSMRIGKDKKPGDPIAVKSPATSTDKPDTTERIVVTGQKKPIISEKKPEITQDPPINGNEAKVEISAIPAISAQGQDRTPEETPMDDHSSSRFKQKAAGTEKPVFINEAAGQKVDNHLVDISFQESEADVRLRVETAHAIQQFKHFFMKEPYRLVINLPGIWNYAGKLVLPGSNGLIRRIRIGKHEEQISIVVDLHELEPVAANVINLDLGLEIILTKQQH